MPTSSATRSFSTVAVVRRRRADAYEASEHDGVPERGDYVFCDCLGTIDGERQDWGHIGISLGEGLVVHAWDEVRIDGYLEIEQLERAPGWASPSYLGWTPVAEVLRGMKAGSESERPE
jgi:hypothetical protein